jgi:hypothetical protein
MISARLVLATVIGGQMAIAPVASAAEPVRKPTSAPLPTQSQESSSAQPAMGAKSASTSAPAPAPLPTTGSATHNPAKADAWTPAEIAEAKAHCTANLKGLDVVVIPEDPIKQGACGAAAPVTLISLGKNPEVVLSPPATVTCDVVAALDTWLRNDLQPLARKLLGAPIVKIETMSSYSCRNAYGRANTNLSEHARANALDIGGFLTASAQTTRVLASWGPTQRQIKAQALAAPRAAEQKAAEERAMAEIATTSEDQPAQQISTEPERDGNSVAGALIAAMNKGLPGIPVRLPGTSGTSGQTGLGLAVSSRLGGPNLDAKPASAASLKAGQEARRTQFLRQAHAAACKYFGTVLGPEANADHENHFHVDMAERQRSHFCE